MVAWGRTEPLESEGSASSKLVNKEHIEQMTLFHSAWHDRVSCTSNAEFNGECGCRV